MRKFVIAVLTAVFGFSTAAAADSDYLSMSWDKVVEAAKKQGSLTFYSWWGEEFWKTAGRDFEKETGIEVKVIIGDLTANLNKIVAEKNRDAGTIDVIHVGGAEMPRTMIGGNLLYGPIQDVIPDADKTDSKLRRIQEGIEVKGFMVPVYRNQTGLLYDPQRVDAPPQNWAELSAWIKAHPKQFAFSDPTKGGSGQAFIQAALVNILGDRDRYVGDTELDPAKIADWGAVWKWFNDNEDNYVVTGSNNESIDKLNQGEVSLIAAWDDDTAIALRKGTLFKRAKLYVPEMGMAGGGDSIAVLVNAPHKAAGLRFVAYLIEKDVQLKMNRIIGPYLARTDVSGGSAILPEEQRQNNGRPWIPGAYKTHFIEEFVKQVLLK